MHIPMTWSHCTAHACSHYSAVVPPVHKAPAARHMTPLNIRIKSLSAAAGRAVGTIGAAEGYKDGVRPLTSTVQPHRPQKIATVTALKRDERQRVLLSLQEVSLLPLQNCRYRIESQRTACKSFICCRHSPTKQDLPYPVFASGSSACSRASGGLMRCWAGSPGLGMTQPLPAFNTAPHQLPEPRLLHKSDRLLARLSSTRGFMTAAVYVSVCVYACVALHLPPRR